MSQASADLYALSETNNNCSSIDAEFHNLALHSSIAHAQNYCSELNGCQRNKTDLVFVKNE